MTISRQFQLNRCALLLLTVFCFYSAKAFSQANVSASYYWDDRHFNTLALQIASNSLPMDLSLWGFSDFHADQNNSHERQDFTKSFSEYRLSSNAPASWTGLKNLGAQIEYNDFTAGNENTLWRAGITYKYTFLDRLWMQLRVLPLQSNEDWQISLIYKLTITERLKLNGFADYNLRQDKGNMWVIEPQLEYKMSANSWLLLEYRLNDFEQDNPALDGYGWALGVRYHL